MVNSIDCIVGKQIYKTRTLTSGCKCKLSFNLQFRLKKIHLSECTCEVMKQLRVCSEHNVRGIAVPFQVVPFCDLPLRIAKFPACTVLQTIGKIRGRRACLEAILAPR